MTTIFPHDHSTRDAIDLTIRARRLYWHKTVRINYTTDNLRRAQDSINIRSGNVMVCASEEAEKASNGHPYSYGRVIGIFHVDVSYTGKDAPTMGPFSKKAFGRVDVLWVRWYAFDLSKPWGLQARRLPRLSFVPAEQDDAFGFVDPGDVIRAAHIIPSFASGSTTNFLSFPNSLARPEGEESDYNSYHVGMYVLSLNNLVDVLLMLETCHGTRFSDRDMLMRYIGGGVGHISTQDASAAMRSHSQAYAGKLTREESEERVRLQEAGVIPNQPVAAQSSFHTDEDSDSDGSMLVDPDADDNSENDDWSIPSDSDDEDFDPYGQRWRYADKKSRPRPVAEEDVPDGLEDRDETEAEEQGYRVE